MLLNGGQWHIFSSKSWNENVYDVLKAAAKKKENLVIAEEIREEFIA